MEIIGYGILLAIGFYMAPLVITFVVGLFVVLMGVLRAIFGGK